MKKQLLLVLSLALFASGFAQNRVRLNSHNGISDQFTAISENLKINFTPSAAKEIFGLNLNSNFVLTKTESDRLGFVHFRFYQSYQNIPIDKTMFIAHTKNGLLRNVSGSIVTEFDPEMDKKNHASISPSKAIDIAIENVHAKIYAWQDAGMQERIKEQNNNYKASYYPTAALVFYNSGEVLAPRELRLCYKVDVYALQPLSRAYYFVDAQTGSVLGKEDEIYFSDATGTANTAWSGTQTIHSDKTGGSSYRLRDYTRGSGVITLHGESGKRGQEYTSTSSDWHLTGFDQAAMDAHFGVEQTYSYYQTNFGRNSYDGNGTALYSYVNDPTYIDNAFWDGSAMNFNKRSNGDPGGVTGIDVTGHELTHGVTQTSCGLNYSFESGAMNESLSDIMGKSVQFWAKSNDINWLLSNDMNWIIRDMSNPNAEFQPDTYKGTYWYTGGNDNGGVHTNSGVGNFMFYLLVTGGSGTNDKGDAYTVSGIGLSKSDQIIYRSQTVYLTQTSQYINWRDACINSATDLYGSTSNEVAQVKNAFYAVGIGSDANECEAPGSLNVTNITKTTATLGWNAVATATGYTVQWKLSTSTKWTTVSGIFTNSYKLTGLKPGFSYEYKVQTSCSNGNTSVYSTAYTFTTLTKNGENYCAGYGKSTTYEYIQRVAVGDKGYTSGDNNGYGNFTSLAGDLTAGSAYTLTLTPGFSGMSYKEYWAAYIDYNMDGDFTDAGENIGTAASTTEVSLNFTVPAGAINGTTRLRIQMSYRLQSDPCSVFNYGEVEDYSAKIKGGTNAVTAGGINAENITALTIAPNPVKENSARISVNLIKQGSITIKVADLSGRLLLVQQIGNATVGKNVIVLNGLNALQNGAFLVMAEQNGIIIGRSQLLVNR